VPYEHLRRRCECVGIAGEDQCAEPAAERGQVRSFTGAGEQQLVDELSDVPFVADPLSLARGRIDVKRKGLVVPFGDHVAAPRIWVDETTTVPCMAPSAARQ